MSRNILKDNRGFIFIVMALGVLVVLCGLAGLALDVGRAYIVKSELQNAADASALAGAGRVYDTTTTPYVVNWSQATQTATDFIGKNKADGQPLKSGLVVTGWWNIETKTFAASSATTSPGSCSASKTTACTRDSDCPPVAGKPDVCFPVSVPAVKVTIAKAVDNDNGPVRTFFASVLGWNNFQPGATGMALTGFPGATPPGTTFPFAVSECLKEDFVNKTGIFSGGANPPITLTSQVSTSQGSTLGGLWTNLTNGVQTNDNTVQGYIKYLVGPDGKNYDKGIDPVPSPSVKTGDYIDVTNGANNKLYQWTDDLIKSGKSIVFVPVVQCNLSSTTTDMQILGFAEVQLIKSNDPVNTIIGQFVDFAQAPAGAAVGGVASNSIIPPKMAQ